MTIAHTFAELSQLLKKNTDSGLENSLSDSSYNFVKVANAIDLSNDKILFSGIGAMLAKDTLKQKAESHPVEVAYLVKNIVSRTAKFTDALIGLLKRPLRDTWRRTWSIGDMAETRLREVLTKVLEHYGGIANVNHLVQDLIDVLRDPEQATVTMSHDQLYLFSEFTCLKTLQESFITELLKNYNSDNHSSFIVLRDGVRIGFDKVDKKLLEEGKLQFIGDSKYSYCWLSIPSNGSKKSIFSRKIVLKIPEGDISGFCAGRLENYLFGENHEQLRLQIGQKPGESNLLRVAKLHLARGLKAPSKQYANDMNENDVDRIYNACLRTR